MAFRCMSVLHSFILSIYIIIVISNDFYAMFRKGQRFYRTARLINFCRAPNYVYLDRQITHGNVSRRNLQWCILHN